MFLNQCLCFLDNVHCPGYLGVVHTLLPIFWFSGGHPASLCLLGLRVCLFGGCFVLVFCLFWFGVFLFVLFGGGGIFFPLFIYLFVSHPPPPGIFVPFVVREMVNG